MINTYIVWQATHWKAIFVGMGEKYDTSWQLTVDQLISYQLLEHEALINAIYSRAQSEYQLEQKLNKLEKMWSSNEIYFKLAKHIPDTVYTAGMCINSPSF